MISPQRSLCIGLILTLGTGLVSGCRRNTSATPARSPAPVPVAPVTTRSDVLEVAKGCEAQAARVASHGTWNGSPMRRAADAPLRWQGHYSTKYDECYVLIDHLIPVEKGAAAVVSELWNAFDATVLAECTNDPRTRIRRNFCQVSLSDDPFTSCLVSKYFIDEHMSH